MIFYITYTFAFYIGTEQVITGSAMSIIIKCFFSDDENCRVTGASVMCCIYGVILCVTFIGLMTPGITAINVGRQAAVEVFDTISREPTIDPSSTTTGMKLKEVQGKIEFRRIFFYYPSRPNKPVFYNFNLEIEPGQSVALVGPSGSGKSTIAKLLLRFYDPKDGDVLVDGVPLRELNVAWWRSKVGYVSQEPRLFPGTIRDNIALGKGAGEEEMAATDEEIIAAAKAACAHDFIMELPEGYSTFYSGTSVQLSGGQMQRIAIARAIIRNPRLLVLDEATSALDSTSERHVQEALANVRKLKRMTTVTIAHRLSTIIDSDQIAVLTQGSISELGDHKSLMEKGGIYALLCQSQGITADFSTTTDLTQAPSTGGTVEVVQAPSKDGLVEVTEEQPKPAQEKEDDLDELVEVEMAPMSKIWRHVGSDGIYTIIGLLGSVIIGALSPCESILTAQIVTTFYTYPPEEMLEANRKWILRFFYFALAAFVGNLMVGIGLSRSGTRLAGKMRRIAFSAILRRSMGWFDEPENTTGELTTLLGRDAEAVSGLTGIELGYRVRVISSLTTGVVVALLYSFQIGLIAIACVPMIMIAGVVQVICMRRKFAVETDDLSPPTILEQGLRGIASVQAYNLQTKVGDDYAKALEPESAGKVKRGAVAGLVFGFSQCAIFISFALVFYVGTDLLVEVEINFLEFFTALLAVMFGALGASQVRSFLKRIVFLAMLNLAFH
jgi:ABC-type multidrug transport system fused ATPase/permease subunit